MSGLPVQMTVPYITVDEYSRQTGIKIETIRHLIKEGRLPIRPKARPRDLTLINVLALMQEANQHAQSFVAA